LFIVKKLNRKGNYDSVRLIDKNGSFRGEARFESREQAERYIEKYKGRINKKLMAELKPKLDLNCKYLS
jgi:hypothetical protein